MRFYDALTKPLAPLLATLLIAGCAAPTIMPRPADVTGSGAVTLSLSVLGGDYQAQYVREDISELVVGVVDVASDADPTLGYEDGDRSAEPVFHAAIAGALLGGTYTPGVLDFSAAAGLSDAEKTDYKRYLYRSLSPSDGITATRNVTFDNLPAGENRYIVFAAAFEGSGRTLSDVIGFEQFGPFSVTAGATAAVTPLTLDLDRGMASVTVTVRFDETSMKLINTEMLVVTLVDADHTRARLYLGYEGGTKLTGEPGYHSAITNLLDFSVFAPSLDPLQRPELDRRLYYTAYQTGFTDPSGDREIKFKGLKPGGPYVVHAAAFSGLGNDPSEPPAQSHGEARSPVFNLTRGQTYSLDLPLVLQP